jgi:hypothetical protein
LKIFPETYVPLAVFVVRLISSYDAIYPGVSEQSNLYLIPMIFICYDLSISVSFSSNGNSSASETVNFILSSLWLAGPYMSPRKIVFLESE